jgi:hypothetical protein
MGRATLFQTQIESSYSDPGHTPRSGNTFSLLGIILAPPLSVICQILWNLLFSERQAHLRLIIEEMEGSPSPLMLGGMERLAGLLETAEPILETTLTYEPHICSIHPSLSLAKMGHLFPQNPE